MTRDTELTPIPRRIVDFHQDDAGEWVAVLECGHQQHVHHHPPWQDHPWVITAEGRTRFLNHPLPCRLCADESADHG